jgi:uncharacterized small protein (DUF1192 family)
LYSRNEALTRSGKAITAEFPMADSTALSELDQRIAVVRDNIRRLTEQAAAVSGAADESHTADLISEQEAQLATLLKEREGLAK